MLGSDYPIIRVKHIEAAELAQDLAKRQERGGQAEQERRYRPESTNVVRLPHREPQ